MLDKAKENVLNTLFSFRNEKAGTQSTGSYSKMISGLIQDWNGHYFFFI